MYAGGLSWACGCVPTNSQPGNEQDAEERGSSAKFVPKGTLRLFQWNADVIKLKINELGERMKNLGVDIALIQESKLRVKDKTPRIEGYSTVRADRRGPKPGGGLISFVKDDIAFESRPCWNQMTGNVESSRLKIWLSKKSWITLHNLYIPTNRDTNTEEVLVLDNLQVGKDSFFGGDLNGHSQLWDQSQPQDSRGDRLEEWMADNDLVCANDGWATRVNRGTAGLSSPDVLFTPSSWSSKTEWTVGECLGSDHLPVVITIRCTVVQFPQLEKNARWKKKDVNWAAFSSAVEEPASSWNPLDTVHRRAKKFTEDILSAAKEHVGKTKPGKHRNAGISATVRALVKKRNFSRRRINTHRQEWVTACGEVNEG